MEKLTESSWDSSCVPIYNQIKENRMLLPENVVDKAVTILNFDPDEPSFTKNPDFPRTKKEELWDELVYAIHLGKLPTPSEIGATPNEIKKYAAEKNKLFQKFLIMLKETEYDALHHDRAIDMPTAFAYCLRKKSVDLKKDGDRLEVLRPSKSDKDSFFNAYPYDQVLARAIPALEKMATYFEGAAQELSESVPGTGKGKAGKDRSDDLVFRLCGIYKKYTGEIPISNQSVNYNAADSHRVTGRIIPFLRLILELTAYNQELTDIALMGRVRRLRENKKYASLWVEH